MNWLIRRSLRLAWLAAIWAYPKGIISLRTFCRIDDEYYYWCVRELS